MKLHWAILTCGVAAFTVNSAAVAAAQDAHEMRKGSMVNITACVTPSIDGDADEFVLTNVVAVPAHPASAGKVFYWVGDRSKFTSFVGKRVQFDAEIDDADRMIIEIKHRDGSRNDKPDPVVAEIDIEGDEIWIKPELIGLSSAMTDPDDDVDVPVTSVKLKVRNTATVVSGACNTAMTTDIAASSLEVDTRVETEPRTTAVAETETARVDTPVAAVEVEKPAAAVEIEAAAETPAVTRVAEADVETKTTRSALPVTATPLPLLLLLGLGSLSGAAALRIRRK